MQYWTSQFFQEVTQCWVKDPSWVQAQNLGAIHDYHQLSARTARKIITKAIECALVTLAQVRVEQGCLAMPS